MTRRGYGERGVYIFTVELSTCTGAALSIRRGQRHYMALHKVFTIFISERGEEEEEEEESSGGGVVERVLTGEGGDGN